MESNLYDFLRYVQMAAGKAIPGAVPLGSPSNLYVPLAPEVRDWLNTYMQNPGVVIEFRARATGRMVRIPAVKPPPLPYAEDALPNPKAELPERMEPEVEQHYALAGTAQEVFDLLVEAMLLNPTFAQVAISASRAYLDAAPMCRRCSQRHRGRAAGDCPNPQNPSWEFKKRDH